MATLVVRKFGSYNDANLLLRGDILSGPLGNAAPVVSPTLLLGLHGKTLIFTTPATTVTFSDATQAGLSISAIALQIQTALTASHVVSAQERRLRIEKATPGVIVLSGTGTANALLGFGNTTTTTVKYAAPDGVAPRFISMVQADGQAFLVVTEE